MGEISCSVYNRNLIRSTESHNGDMARGLGSWTVKTYVGDYTVAAVSRDKPWL